MCGNPPQREESSGVRSSQIKKEMTDSVWVKGVEEGRLDCEFVLDCVLFACVRVCPLKSFSLCAELDLVS